jgi:uncharacterized caspase-like protein
VIITALHDADVSSTKLDTTFEALAAKVRPSDVFLFFAAGHGKTFEGRYYFVPQGFKRAGATATRREVQTQGIAQDQWQTWFSKIPARRSVLLFDTCESGTLTGEARETEALERAAASDRLVRAIGRSILTASSGDKDAIEGYRGHGLFTYNLMEALGRADGDGNGTIELTELATYVYAHVTALSERVFKERQEPQIRITSNYALTKPAPASKDAGIVIPSKPTHQLSAATDLFVVPNIAARRVRKLESNTSVTLVRSEAGWALIAREGRPLGYVAAHDLGVLR